MDYKPYTAEWSRKRYLSEAIQKYFEDNVPADVIASDIIDTLEEWASSYRSAANKLEEVISKIK
jgi:hypothetical protein